MQKKYRQDNPKSNEIGCVQVVGTGRNKVGNEDRVVGRDDSLLHSDEP